ncbi:MAG TPA: hypothetical protein VL523_07155 [Terriglobia bacterium]|nr:hypothetical protein [Terriglobia bacterium]
MIYPPQFPQHLKPRASAKINELRRKYRQPKQQVKRIKAQALAFADIAYVAAKDGEYQPGLFEEDVKQAIRELCADDRSLGGHSLWDDFGELQAEVFREVMHDDKWQKYLDGIAQMVDDRKKPTLADTRRAFVMPLLASKGWSILDWANNAGVSYHAADDYLSARRRSYLSTRQKLAVALGIPVDRLP